MNMSFSIIIPTCRPWSSVIPLLESINKQSYLRSSKKCKHQILWIFNHPDSSEIKRAQNDFQKNYLKFKDLNIKFLSCDLGVNQARNLGIEFANTDLLFFWDDDCVLQNEFLLENYINLFDQYPELSALGGYYLPPLESSFLQTIYIFQQNNWLNRGYNLRDNSHEYLVGGNFSIRKNNIKNIRFDSSIIFGGSESKFFLDLRQQGLKLRLDEKLSVVHYCLKYTRDSFLFQQFKDVPFVDSIYQWYKMGEKAYLQGQKIEPGYMESDVGAIGIKYVNIRPQIRTTSFKWEFCNYFYQYCFLQGKMKKTAKYSVIKFSFIAALEIIFKHKSRFLLENLFWKYKRSMPGEHTCLTTPPDDSK